MNKIKKIHLILISFCCLTQIIFSQSGWYQLNVGTNRNFKSVFFVDQNTGYITGDTLIKTTNGGINWTFLPYHNSNAVYFFNSQTGFIGFRNVVGSYASIGKTTDGGLTWVFTNMNPNIITNTFSFVNQMTGWAAAGTQFDGYIFKTTNGGDTWVSCFSSFAQYWVQFLDNNTGYCMSVYADEIFRSTDGGSNWTLMNRPAGYSWYVISATDTNTLYLGSSIGAIAKSTDGANTWIVQQTPVSNSIISFFWVNAVTGWAVGGSLGASNGAQVILKTTNSGTNWYVQQGVPPYALFSVFFINSNTGWAVGDSGRVIKTTNGGTLVGIQPSGNEIPEKFNLFQNYPNPFNPSTGIKFGLPKKAFTKLVIYDLLGKEVSTLVNEQLQAGTYEINWDAGNFASGIYFYRIESGDFVQTKKMLLVK